MVVAFERVALYGLTVVAKRSVHYGPINPEEARRIFIRQALAAGDYITRAPFFEHNRQLMREVQALEHKARRRDVLVDEETIFAFYDAIIPAGIVNGAGFEAWRREAEEVDPKRLFLTREYLMRHAAADITEQQFPESLQVNGADLKLRYRFEPSHPLDGVTVSVPLHLLNTLEAAPFEWLVPGMIREKVAFAFKALPKAIRRQLVPIPEQVTAFLADMETGAASGEAREALSASLARFVQRRAGQPVAQSIWDDIDLPQHLRMNFRVVDEAGRELASGRDLAALRTQLGEAAQLTFSTAAPGIERENIRLWDFGDLPREISFTRNSRKLTGYPALTDEGDSVAIRLFDVRQTAEGAMRAGVRRLIRLALKEQMKQLERNLRAVESAVLQMRAVASADELKADLVDAIADRAFIGDDALPRTPDEFEMQRARARTRLPAVTEAACRLHAAIAVEYQRVAARLLNPGSAAGKPAADIRAQLGGLVHKRFFSATPWERLAHVPRYLKAMQVRLDKYPKDPERDAKHAASIAELFRRYEERLEQRRKAGAADPQLEEFRWHLEELRVSLFAQELRTPYPVSVKRLQKLWGALAF
jgi:ATP-dependent helicase HrpA